MPNPTNVIVQMQRAETLVFENGVEVTLSLREDESIDSIAIDSDQGGIATLDFEAFEILVTAVAHYRVLHGVRIVLAAMLAGGTRSQTFRMIASTVNDPAAAVAVVHENLRRLPVETARACWWPKDAPRPDDSPAALNALFADCNNVLLVAYLSTIESR